MRYSRLSRKNGQRSLIGLRLATFTRSRLYTRFAAGRPAVICRREAACSSLSPLRCVSRTVRLQMFLAYLLLKYRPSTGTFSFLPYLFGAATLPLETV